MLAAALGDAEWVIPATKLMAYSDHPAVRLCAARELGRLRNPTTVEWFDYAARNDDRHVRNDGCGREPEFFYPVRTAAVLALRDLGIEFKSDEELRRQQEREREQKIRAIMARELESQRRRKTSPPPRPSVPAGGIPR